MTKRVSFRVWLLAATFMLNVMLWRFGPTSSASAAPEFTTYITGQIIADDGGPLGEMTVEVHPGGYPSKVDAQGRYTVTLPNQQYSTTVSVHFLPNWQAGSFVMKRLYPQNLTLEPGEVRHGIDITLPVGGKLAGTLVDAHMRMTVPVTLGFAIKRQTGDLVQDYAYATDGKIGRLDPYLPGDYVPEGVVTTTHPIRIVPRTTTTATFIYDDPAWPVRDVLTVPGMPNTLGLVIPGGYRMLLSQNAGASFQNIPFPLGFANARQDGVMLTQRSPTDPALRVVMAEPVPAPMPQYFPSTVTDIHLLRSGDLGQSWSSISATRPSCDGAPVSSSMKFSTFDTVVVSPRLARRAYAIGKCRNFQSYGFSDDEQSPYYQLYVSDDFGVKWERRFSLGIHFIQFVSALAQDDRVFFISEPYGGTLEIVQSSDAGRTWVTTTTSLVAPSDERFTLVADGGLSNTLYLLAPSLPLRVSDDAGATWENRTLPPACAGPFVAVPGRPRLLLMACADALYRSQDSGQSWQKLAVAGRGLFVDYANSGRIYLEIYKDLWASDDAGDTWRPVWNVPGAKKQFVPIVRA
jgi:hypothetical protein